MRITSDDILHEFKLRLEKEKSLKKKYQIKQIVELIKDL